VHYGRVEAHGWYFMPVYEDSVVLKIEGTNIREVPVTEGVTDGAQVQVLDGLQAGDVIVSDARRQIPPGEAVNPVFAK